MPETARLVKVQQPLQEIGRVSIEIIRDALQRSGAADHTPRRQQVRLQPVIEFVGF
jgi:hypothetical protein